MTRRDWKDRQDRRDRDRERGCLGFFGLILAGSILALLLKWVA
jgi:hypothetical protein